MTVRMHSNERVSTIVIIIVIFKADWKPAHHTATRSPGSEHHTRAQSDCAARPASRRQLATCWFERPAAVGRARHGHGVALNRTRLLLGSP